MTLNHTTYLTAALALLCCCGCHSAPPLAPAPPVPPSAAAAGGVQVVAIAAPAPPPVPPPSIFDFLGVPQIVQTLGALGDHLCAKIGMVFPSAEPGPPILPLTAPGNFDPAGPPAVKVGAEIKAEQDLAAQKIKGLRYLATIGCGGCYPDVEHAILASLDDCTEAVRYEAVLALRNSTGNFCKLCNNKRCCSPAVRKRLQEIAFKMKERNCFCEPSDRVRLEARLALKACGGGGAAPVIEQPYMEGPPAPGAVGSLNNPGWRSGRLAGTSLAAKAEAKAVASAIASSGISAGEPLDGGEPPVTDPSTSGSAVQTASAGELVESYDQNTVLVQWERISAPTHRFASREDAYNALLFLRRKILSQPAGEEPEVDPSLIELVLHPYINPSQAPSPEIAAALEALPRGDISPVIEDAAGFHLVRVLDRRMRTPAAVQDDGS